MQSYARLPVTFSLITANVLVYLGIVALGVTRQNIPWNVALVNQPGTILEAGWLVPQYVAQGEAWRLLTSMFLQSGFAHIAFNMVALYFLGTLAESAFGHWRFLVLYLLGGLSGGIALLYFGDFSGPAVGASGAIFGLLGSVLGYSLRQGTFSWQNPLIRQLLILLGINVWLGLSIGNISNTAHMGGLVGGFVFGWLMAPTVYSRKLSALRPVVLVLVVELALLAFWLFYPVSL
ncbi:MAG: rhomboid family intramembrane serine protease [Rubrobacteraceae bacterium]